MFEYKYTPEHKNKTAKSISSILFFTALILLALVACFDLAYEGIMQSVAVLCAVMLILILTRYQFKKFTYKVFQTEKGDYDLTVDEIMGRSCVTVCRVSLSNVEKIMIVKKNNEDRERLRCEARGRKTFSYCPDMLPSSECCVFVTECGEKLVIKLSPDETLLSILNNFAE